MIRLVGRGLRSFGHFWWDFLIGDTPELFVAVLVLVGSAYGLRHVRVAAIVVLPVLAAVFLEGLEVVLIVISLGASQHKVGLAAAAAGAAAVVVAVAGLLVSRQLSEVPENTIKTVVGVMLTSFGLFWVGEGAGIGWPGSDLAVPVLVGVFIVVTLVAVAWLRG